jgi:hypothetical protein
MFSIRNGLAEGEVLSPLLFNFALGYEIRSLQVIQDGLKLNGIHQHLVCADDFSILGERVYIIVKNTDVILSAELNIDKTKHMVISSDENVGRSRV